jgi:hypothetical protein
VKLGPECGGAGIDSPTLLAFCPEQEEPTFVLLYFSGQA